MTDLEYVQVPRWAVERVRAYVDASSDDAMFLSAPEVDNILAALDEALA
jgi:hypothetical protein